jgi:N utilization substance protein A
MINRVSVRDYEGREMEVIVSEDQLSLAIGKRGQNVRLASKLVGWKLDIKSEAEKKAEIEAEMERMAQASRELSSLPGIAQSTVARLLDAGFRSIEEICLASLEDLTSIDGISEDEAIEIHDAAEQALEARAEEYEAAEAEAAAQAEVAGGETQPTEPPEEAPAEDAPKE